jgi:hypothetical protein
MDFQMINTTVETHPRVAAPRPYQQKMLVTVARKVAAEVDTENSKSRDFPLAKISQDELIHSPTIGKLEPDEYQESFARMMVNLSMKTPDTQTSAKSSYSDSTDEYSTKYRVDTLQKNDLAANSPDASASLNASTNQQETRSAKDDFMDYMNQTDAEKLRQELTGVTKEEYDQMSPEEKLVVDEKLEQLLKNKQEIAQVQIKAKIALAKTMESELT